MKLNPKDPQILLLAIESSCDETAAAVLRGLSVKSNIIASQAKTHAEFGGVVPEIASRQHVEAIVPVIAQALSEAGVLAHELDAVAVTDGPGLVGALLVGASAARGFAAAIQKPLWGIHHHEGHLFSALLEVGAASPGSGSAIPDEDRGSKGGDDAAKVGGDRILSLDLPAHLALVVSGGHTTLIDVQGLGRYRILGQTRDDAVGEAFDKGAKLLGLGYPGGPIIDRLAVGGDPAAHDFPRAMRHQDTVDFSFSGLKTALAQHIDRHGQPQSRQALSDLCASFQEAIAETLVIKTVKALEQSGHSRLHVVGGAAANSRIRAMMQAACQKRGVNMVAAPLRYCGDNAVMIGVAGMARMLAGTPPGLEVRSWVDLEDLVAPPGEPS